ncbi:MAG: hypothetical protein J0H69_03750 [Burkholderiales bacterium]|nr:hypothetical protein [Burkholderiales bacterium]
MHDLTPAPAHPRRRALIAGALASGLMAAAPFAAQAQPSFPSQPVKVIVPFGPGGLADISMRLVAQKLGERLGQPMVVENRPGAGGVVAANAALNAPRDGHTLILFSNGTAISKSLFKLANDPETDFVPISSMAYFDLILLVKADGGVPDLASLLALSRRRPLNIGTINPGSTQNLSAELFKSVAKIEATVIPFKSTPEVLTALMRGDVDVGFESYAALKGAVNGGQVRAIAATAGARSPWLPQVPTVREAGVAGYEVTGWNALYAPAGTPSAAVQAVNAAMQEVMQLPDVRQRLLQLGTEPRASSPADMAAVFKRDAAKWAEVIRRAGIQMQ